MEPNQSQSNALFAPILVVRYHDHDYWDFSLCALILVPTDDRGTTYTRQGIFNMNFTDRQIKKCETALDGAGLEFSGENGRTIRAKESCLKTIVIV